MDYISNDFVWDTQKEADNIRKHGLNFVEAALVFNDPNRKIFIDEKHSCSELRYFCIGVVCKKVATVRFMHRAGSVRILGAGYWRKGRKYYEQEK